MLLHVGELGLPAANDVKRLDFIFFLTTPLNDDLDDA
jgi:hypothetical protein